LDIACGPVTVKDAPGSLAAPVGDVQLQLLLGLLALQGVANPQRNPGQVDLFQPVAHSFQQPDGEQSRPASVLYSHVPPQGGEPAFLRGLATHWAARRFLRR